MNPISLIIAIADRTRRRRVSQSIDGSPLVEIVAETPDLMTTFAEVEERQPMAVIIDGSLARAEEFEVMRALFAALDVRWIVISDEPDSGNRVASAPWGRSSDLFAVPADISAEPLIERLRSLTRTARRAGPAALPRTPAPARPEEGLSRPRSNRFILIGASTGGVDALLTVLSNFPADCPPTFIVQHTGGGFGESLTRLLDRQCRAQVRPARDGDQVTHGEIVLAAGSRAHMRLAGGKPMRITLQAGGPISGHMPSVDAMFQSAVPGAKRAVAALLTGMGRDGAAGLKALREAGATTFAQDEATSTVYGMPRAAMEIGAAQRALPLPRIGPEILEACQTDAAEINQRTAMR
ncbi:chemotaxis protein CheB [Salipiger bermudensis]|uniref:CheB methylesterase domain-containing protein n=1 Tax=Salipiger bermudensis TaxID=344736 RepID=UPI001C990D8F|nr:CheB methylesterase domain-containing protein [Salipiger bermudensis]MBY6002456.1 chemotaxis protein CheB [Salipiger bermudensis]